MTSIDNANDSVRNIEKQTTPVRLPGDLRDWLKHQAIDNHRTLSNEILVRLEASRERQVKGQP